LSRYSHSTTSILQGWHMPNGNKKLGWNEYIFYQGLLMLLHTRIGHRGHKLNLLGDCLDICTTLPLYYQIAMCRMATKSWAEMNIFSTRAFWGYYWSNGQWGHKLNLLGDCLDIQTTIPLYYQVAICRMATKSWAEMNIFSTRAFWGYYWSNGHRVPKFFFIFNQFFFHLYQSCLLLRGVTRKNRERSHILGTWYLAVFQKKLGTKLFIFTI
jgi:hypothetical protein